VSIVFPGLFQAAHDASRKGERGYAWLTALRLAFAVLAAILGVLPVIMWDRVDIPVLGVAVGFLGVILVEYSLVQGKPHVTWHEAGKLADSVEGYAWRYVAGGWPFTIGDTEADAFFVEKMESLRHEAEKIRLPSTTGEAITAEMQAHRKASLEDRRKAYLADRIEGLQRRYHGLHSKNTRHANWWRLVLFFGQIVGFCAALARAYNLMHVNVAGIFAALVAAGVAWLGVKQHDACAHMYSNASHELGIHLTRLREAKSEQEWATMVSGAEEAISRAQAQWLAFSATLWP
jgi:hypothetical protein